MAVGCGLLLFASLQIVARLLECCHSRTELFFLQLDFLGVPGAADVLRPLENVERFSTSGDQLRFPKCVQVCCAFQPNLGSLDLLITASSAVLQVSYALPALFFHTRVTPSCFFRSLALLRRMPLSTSSLAHSGSHMPCAAINGMSVVSFLPACTSPTAQGTHLLSSMLSTRGRKQLQ